MAGKKENLGQGKKDTDCKWERRADGSAIMGGGAGESEVGVKTHREGQQSGQGPPETCLAAVPTHTLLNTTAQVQGES